MAVGFCWDLMLLWTLGVIFESTCTVYGKWKVSRIVARLWKWIYKSLRLPIRSRPWCCGYGCRFSVREFLVRILWIANFWFSFYEICVQNQRGSWNFEILVMDSDTGGPSSINFRIEYVFAFQIY